LAHFNPWIARDVRSAWALLLGGSSREKDYKTTASSIVRWERTWVNEANVEKHLKCISPGPVSLSSGVVTKERIFHPWAAG